MGDSFDGKKIRFIINIIYIVIIVFIVYVLFRYAFSLFLPFFIALIISYIAEPAILIMTKRLKIKRFISAAICITFYIVILCAVIALLSATLFAQIRVLVSSLPEYGERIMDYLEDLASASGSNPNSLLNKLMVKLLQYMRSVDTLSLVGGVFGRHVFNSLSGVMVSIPSLVMSVIITFVSSIFISSSFAEIKEFILIQFSEKGRRLILQIKQSTVCIFKKYVKSYAALMLITFAELTVMFMIFNIQPAASLAFVISAVDILPVLGVGTVMIPWAAITFINGGVTKGIVLLAIYAVIAVVREIIEPKILGTNIGLHPLATLISLYAGLKLLGLAGMFIVPIALILISDLQKKGYIRIWNEKTVDKKQK